MRALVVRSGIVVLDPEDPYLALPTHCKGIADVRTIINVNAFLYLILSSDGAVLSGLADLIVGPFLN